MKVLPVKGQNDNKLNCYSITENEFSKFIEKHKKLKHLEFYIIDKAGHSMLEKDIQNQLIDCTNRFVKY